jgi:hypothetical protein
MWQNNYQKSFEEQLLSLDLQIRRKSMHSKNYILLLTKDDLWQDSYYLYINLFLQKRHIINQDNDKDE